MEAEDTLALRALIPDDAALPADQMFTDDQLDQFYRVAGGSLLRAAGYACLAIGTSEALISKVIQTQDLRTDGAKVATALTEKAKVLFEQADAMDAGESDDYFDIIDYGWVNTAPELTETEWRW